MSAVAQRVEMVTTTASERWKNQKVKVQKIHEGKADIYVYPDSLMQEIEGFGGTFNELGWDALQSLSSEERAKVMSSLFSEEGVNFVYGRTPIACSDYAFSYYSYNDVKDDYEMRNFNVGRDRYTLIPYIKEALKLRPDLRLWASPWTPPIWMKATELTSRVRGIIVLIPIVLRSSIRLALICRWGIWKLMPFIFPSTSRSTVRMV